MHACYDSASDAGEGQHKKCDDEQGDAQHVRSGGISIKTRGGGLRRCDRRAVCLRNQPQRGLDEKRNTGKSSLRFSPEGMVRSRAKAMDVLKYTQLMG